VTTESDSVHDRVHAFADGELEPADAELFRVHLVDCEQCQAELRDIMVMAALTQTLGGAAGEVTPSLPATASVVTTAEPVKLAPVIPLRPRRIRTWVAATSTALAAAAALAVYYAQRPRPVMIALAETRPIEARLSWQGADHWRPYEVMRAAGGAREAVPLDSLATLERRGDARGVAAGWLLSGEPERAAGSLERAGDSPDADSDRAAVALARGQLEEALERANRALAAAPRHPQASWNRALTLQQLGLTASAARAFDAVAALGEPGWQEEAKKRAEALRAQDGERHAAVERAQLAGAELVARGSVPAPELVRTWPSLMRHSLYEAVRRAPSKAALQALAPVAEIIDRSDGRGHGRSDDERRMADLLDGAGRLAKLPPGAQDFQQLTAADPWWLILADAAAAEHAADAATAERHLRDGEARCVAAAELDHPCAALETALAAHLVKQQHADEAHKIALSALAHARAAGFDGADQLAVLAAAAHERNQPALERAYRDEEALKRAR
jgi:hypothetical protein